MIDHKAELRELAERAQTASEPSELMEIASGLYGLARILDMKAVLQKAREGRRPTPVVYPAH